MSRQASNNSIQNYNRFSSELLCGGTDIEVEKSNLRLVAGQIFDLFDD